MPHFTVEYSDNLPKHINMDEVLDCLHRAACEASIFEPAAVRVRAFATSQYRVADLHEENGFIHVRAHIGSGRPEEVRKEVSKEIFDKLVAKLKPLLDEMTIGISMEMAEINTVSAYRTGNLHERVRARKDKSD